MLLNWDDAHTARWLVYAAEYTRYNDQLAKLITGFSPEGGTLCSLGCGLGLTELALAAHFEHVTCVDISENVIDFLRGEIERRSIGNMDCRVCDARGLTGRWDTVLAILHGDGGDFAGPYLALARRRLIAVTHAPPSPELPPEKFHLRSLKNADTVSAALDAHGLSYTRHDCSIEHGQPLESLADARQFVLTYGKPRPGEALEQYLGEHLIATGRDDFPYYLPKEKHFSVFVIERE